MALLMLPRVVLTHLKAGFRAALRPDPVMIGWGMQAALPTPVKQCRPSLTTVLAGWKMDRVKGGSSALDDAIYQLRRRREVGDASAPARHVVFLTDGKFKFTFPDGKTENI